LDHHRWQLTSGKVVPLTSSTVLLMISEIVFETEFALAKLADILAWLFFHSRRIAIVAFQLYKFVVNAQ
jgi:hypothetical protein